MEQDLMYINMEGVKVFSHCHLLHNHNGTHLYGRWLSVTNVDRKYYWL